jgi:hypothetical protein
VAAGVHPQLNMICVVVDSQRFARVEERPDRSAAQYLVPAWPTRLPHDDVRPLGHLQVPVSVMATPPPVDAGSARVLRLVSPDKVVQPSTQGRLSGG